MMVAMDCPEEKTHIIQAFEVVDRYLNHRTICRLSLVSKSFNEYVHNKADYRKDSLGPCEVHGGNLLSVAIHKYGSTRCFVYTTQGQKNNVRLHMRCDQYNAKPHTKVFEDFISPLAHNPAPFLNEQKEWCFDGRGKRQNFIGDVVGGEIAYEVTRYHISSGALPLIALMSNACGNGFIHCKVANFRNYPSLLKSILTVKKTREQCCEVQEPLFLKIDLFTQKKYFLEINFNDVVLDKDWNKKEKLLKEENFFVLERHSSLRAIIEKYYQKQREKQIDTWCVICPGQEDSYETIF